MAYINYGQATVGGKELAELCADTQRLAARWAAHKAWVAEIVALGSVADLVDHPDFLVATGEGQAFNDTVVSVADAFATFYGNGSADTNAEKIARLARGGI